ncbi:MAG TPA: type VI secretion system baseplate subunit TssK [Polyangia bacterium]|jgi:type VI secretion system protein ImpJ|nr:type VI secretion system baseplate subunit TssK [Polyangia bacterium]
MARDDYGKLARTRWSIGQVLMPAHFQADEEALSQETWLRSGLGGPPSYGVAELVWDAAQLEKGSLAIGLLLLIAPDGKLVAVPGNATVSDLDLKASGARRVTVYLHVRREARGARGLKLYERDPPELERVVQEAVLAASESLDNARLVMKLGDFQKGVDGAWQLDPAYVPPLVRVGPNPFLQSVLTELRQFLRQAGDELSRQLLDGFSGGETRALVRRCQIEAAHLEALLGDLGNGIYVHPYVLFQALRRFYIEVCFLAGLAPESQTERYDHDDLAGTFDRLGSAIAHHLRYRPELSPHREFVRQAEVYTAASLDDPVLKAAEVYLLLQKSSPEERISLDGVKLASPLRLPTVHARALTGIPFEPVPFPTFRHSFGPEVDFYRLLPGAEWEYVRRERALAFYYRRELGQARPALFWREG